MITIIIQAWDTHIVLPADVPAMGEGEGETPLRHHNSADLGRVPISGKNHFQGCHFSLFQTQMIVFSTFEVKSIL